ncbi:MAG: hypothetical protein RLO50_07370 [Azospirillaceae bacterium]
MKRALTAIGLALAIAPAAMTSAMAQDPSLPSTYGDNSLVTGFTPDPATATIDAGGPIDVSATLGGPCVGFVADAPDLRLFYEAGDTFPLIFYVDSGADTTLVINAPDGEWWCNDDADGLNPEIFFDQPLSGQYDIWVGTYTPGSFPEATVFVTELE